MSRKNTPVVVLAGLLLAPMLSLAADAREPPRLRFRDGPPCMCNDGLGEAAIQEAERRRNSKEEDSQGPKSSDDNKMNGDN